MPPKLNSFLRKRQKKILKSSFSFKVKQKNNTICRLQEKKIIRIVNKDIIFDEIRRWTQFNNVKDSIKFQEGLSNSYLLSKTGAIGFWKRKKNLDHFSIYACHPCAGAMLIFSVSFQFYRMSPKGQAYLPPSL